MKARYKISRGGIELIKKFEGLSLDAVRLADGRWSIGYGHTLSARDGARISAEDADALLRFDLLPVADAVSTLVQVDLAQSQFDALASFCFNVGLEAFKQSDVLKRVNQGRFAQAAQALDAWRRSDFAGQSYVLEPLMRRRAAEKALFLSEAYGDVAATQLVRPSLDRRMAQVVTDYPPARLETVQRDGVLVAEVLGLPEPDLEIESEGGIEQTASEAVSVAEVVSDAPNQPANDSVQDAAGAAPEGVPAAEPALGAARTEEAPTNEAPKTEAPVAETEEAPKPRPARTPFSFSPMQAMMGMSSVPRPSASRPVTAPAEAEPEAVKVSVPVEVVSEAASEPKPEPERQVAEEASGYVAGQPRLKPAEQVAKVMPYRSLPGPGGSMLGGFGMTMNMASARPSVAPRVPSSPMSIVNTAGRPEAVRGEPDPEPAPLGGLNTRSQTPVAGEATLAASSSSSGAASAAGEGGRTPAFDEPEIIYVNEPVMLSPGQPPRAAGGVAKPASVKGVGPVEVAPPAPLYPSMRVGEEFPKPIAAHKTLPAALRLEPEGNVDTASEDALAIQLFEAEDWATSRLAKRVVREDEDILPVDDPKLAMLPWLLTASVGMVAFAGAVASYLKSKSLTVQPDNWIDDPLTLTVLLGLATVGLISVSVYFLLKRLGGAES